MRRVWIVLVVLVLVTASARAEDQEDTRAVMRRAYSALSTLLPAALAPEPMTEGNASGELTAAINTLAEAAAQIEAHARPADAGFGFLGRSLANDAALIQKRMSSERFRDAGMLIVRMTENCIACHSRLPSERDPAFAANLVRSVDRGGLSPVHRARLEIALRQFDRALDIHERLMADPEISPAALDFTGALSDYLVVSLRVKEAPERARTHLLTLSRRKDLSETLERALPIWIEALGSLGPSLKGPATLEAAADILERGERLRRYPADRADLIHRVVASSLLYRYVQGENVPRDKMAEAFYLIGISDAFLRRSFERSEAQFYLEQAIRLAPGSDLARVAFAELETETVLAYSGSSGLHLPRDVQRWLAELQQLARPAPERRSGLDMDDARHGEQVVVRSYARTKGDAIVQFQKILVPTDFSKSSDHALERAVELAKLAQGEIHLLHAYELPTTFGGIDVPLALPQEFFDQIRDAAQRHVDDRVQRVSAQGIKAHGYVTCDAPTRAILGTAQEVGADLIVMGTHGRTGIKHVLLGSVAERTVRQADCPVMTVKSSEA